MSYFELVTVKDSRVAHITTAGTQLLKSSGGCLKRVAVGKPPSGTGLVTLYDSLTGSGSVITEINKPSSPVSLEYNAHFIVGLTVVSTGTWDATIVYE